VTWVYNFYLHLFLSQVTVAKSLISILPSSHLSSQWLSVPAQSVVLSSGLMILVISNLDALLELQLIMHMKKLMKEIDLTDLSFAQNELSPPPLLLLQSNPT